MWEHVFNLRNYTVQFADIFKDILIYKFDASKNKVSQTPIRVPILFRPFERIVLELVSEPEEKYYVHLPILSFQLTSMEDDPQRRLPPLGISKVDPNTATAKQTKAPKPKLLHYELNVWAKYIEELNQIIEQIDAKINPATYIRLPIPGFDNEYMRSAVFLDSGPDLDITAEYSQNDRRILRASFKFTVVAWIWLAPVDWDNVIKEIDVNYFYNIINAQKIDEQIIA